MPFFKRGLVRACSFEIYVSDVLIDKETCSLEAGDLVCLEWSAKGFHGKSKLTEVQFDQRAHFKETFTLATHLRISAEGYNPVYLTMVLQHMVSTPKPVVVDSLVVNLSGVDPGHPRYGKWTTPKKNVLSMKITAIFPEGSEDNKSPKHLAKLPREDDLETVVSAMKRIQQQEAEWETRRKELEQEWQEEQQKNEKRLNDLEGAVAKAKAEAALAKAETQMLQEEVWKLKKGKHLSPPVPVGTSTRYSGESSTRRRSPARDRKRAESDKLAVQEPNDMRHCDECVVA